MIFEIAHSIAFDTNIFLYGLRDPTQAACYEILHETLPQLNVFMPQQVQKELRNNLSDAERGNALLFIKTAQNLSWEYGDPPIARVEHWQSQGAKKGDAIICASLEAASVKFLISENRHFLAQIKDLPFQVLSSEQLLHSLET